MRRSGGGATPSDPIYPPPKCTPPTAQSNTGDDAAAVDAEAMASALIRDDDAFAALSNRLLLRRSTAGETPDAIVWESMSGRDRTAYAAAYRHRASGLSTFPEAGEEGATSLVRSVKDTFGPILTNVPPPPPAPPPDRRDGGGFVAEKGGVSSGARRDRDTRRRQSGDRGHFDGGRRAPDVADDAGRNALAFDTPPGPALRSGGNTSSAERRQNPRMSRVGQESEQSPYLRERHQVGSSRLPPPPPRRDGSVHLQTPGQTGNSRCHDDRTGTPGSFNAYTEKSGCRDDRDQEYSTPVTGGNRSPSNRSAGQSERSDRSAGFHHSRDNESHWSNTSGRDSHFSNHENRFQPEPLSNSAGRKPMHHRQFSGDRSSRSDPNREGERSPSNRSHRSSQSNESGAGSHRRYSNDQPRQHDVHYDRHDQQQQVEFGASNEGLRRRISPRSATDKANSSAHSFHPSPGGDRHNDTAQISSTGNNRRIPSGDGGGSRQFRRPWAGANNNPSIPPSAAHQHRTADMESMSDCNRDDNAGRSLASNAVLDAIPSDDLESFTGRRTGGTNPSSASVKSAPMSVSSGRNPLKSVLRTRSNAVRQEPAIDESPENRESQEPVSDTVDDQNIVITGLYQLDIDETQRDLAIREARAVQAQSRMRQHLMEEMERTRDILHRTTDESTRASYERHLKGLQMELDKWNRSLDVSKSSSFGTPKNGLVAAFVEEEEEVDEEEEEGEGEGEGEKCAEEGGRGGRSRSTIVTETSKSMSTASKPQSNIEMAEIHPKTPFAGGTVNIVAPSTLPAGYKFEARLGNNTFIATVPAGGVQKGEVFATPMGEEADENYFSDNLLTQQQKTKVDMVIPHGGWRDELFDCLNDGCFHPMLWNSCFCPQVALTQIMARMRITSRGDTDAAYGSKLTVNSVLGFTLALLLLNGMFIYICVRRPQLALLVICSIPTILLDLSVLLYFFSMTIKIRRKIREQYTIPETRCRGCEDAAVSLCFTCCALAQIGRHTADYSTYRGTCCSETGLPDHVGPNVPNGAGKKVKAGKNEQKGTVSIDAYDEEFAYHEF